MTTAEDYEATGGAFSVEAQMDVRTRTRDAVHAIAERITVGMVEEDAYEDLLLEDQSY